MVRERVKKSLQESGVPASVIQSLDNEWVALSGKQQLRIGNMREIWYSSDWVRTIPLLRCAQIWTKVEEDEKEIVERPVEAIPNRGPGPGGALVCQVIRDPHPPAGVAVPVGGYRARPEGLEAPMAMRFPDAVEVPKEVRMVPLQAKMGGIPQDIRGFMHRGHEPQKNERAA